MKITIRWFGKKYDSVTLEQIKQIPGVKGIITTLYATTPGEVWTKEAIKELKDEVEGAGLEIYGIESVNVHDDIKIGLATRDHYIDNYIESLKNLGEAGIKMVCYNFMPVFDWTRSDLAKVRHDGSTVLAYDQEKIDQIDPDNLAESMEKMSNGFILPGWEPERMAKLTELFEKYKDVDDDKLMDNFIYFLKRIMPTCEKYEIKMAVHPDDPAWPVFGLPRIVRNKESIMKFIKAVDSPYNGMALCAGSLSSEPENNVPDIIRSLKGRIHFAHLRNIQYNSYRNFEESAHISSDGSLDMYELMKAYHDIDFDGPMRPDHGRAIWGEVSMPGYGLFDRALGATYLQGLWEAIDKNKKRQQ